MKHDQKELLYSPKNWAFLSFFFSPILPAIFFYRNSKLLGTSKKGKKVLVGSIIFVIAFLALTFIFTYYASLILFVEAIIASVIAKKLAKTQLAAYEQMKKEKGLKGGRNEAPLISLFFTLWATIAFILPSALDNYLEKNYISTSFGGETVYLPRNNKKKDKPKEVPYLQVQERNAEEETKITLDLPGEYSLYAGNTSASEKSYKYRIQPDDGSFDESSWEVHVIPIEAVQDFDAICAQGDCMRNYVVFPKEAHFLADLESIKEDDEPILSVLNGQKYYVFTTPSVGDIGYSRQYITYFNDVRVVFSAWAQNSFDAEKHDEFLKDVKILGVEN